VHDGAAARFLEETKRQEKVMGLDGSILLARDTFSNSVGPFGALHITC